MQTFIYYAIFAFVLINNVAVGLMAGKPREPITRPVAAISMGINTLLLMGVYTLWKGTP